MTICKQLASVIMPNGETVSAWSRQDKFSATVNYEITKAKNGIAYEVIKCARTTWKQKYIQAIGG